MPAEPFTSTAQMQQMGPSFHAHQSLLHFRASKNNSSGKTLLLFDAIGNCTSLGSFYFEYDYTRTSTNQLYSDRDNTNARMGFRFLQYAGFFPEITNPINVRTRSLAKGGPDADPYRTVDLTGKEFDAAGNLTKYDYRGQPFPIVYYCGKASGK